MEPREFRDSLKMTRVELAAVAGLSEGAIFCMETGSRFPEPATMLKMMRASVGKDGNPQVTEADILRVWCRKNGHAYPAANGSGVVSTRGAEEANPGDKTCRAKPKVRRSAAQVAGAKRQRKTKR